MASPDDEQRLRWLREATGRLAADPRSQLEYLRAFGSAPALDELALGFDDVYAVVPAMVAEGIVSDGSAALLARVDAALTAMSGPARPELWFEPAQETAPEWAEVRRLARAAVASLPAPPTG